ncbi:signal recognition particle receptor subunit alpha, partial [Ochrobactrum sp. SFR4]|uniref:signal recognition particle receptor subunit alpha n=1 Tax=Ochrobactrum sp. SFR4 TaxID=2717368 RepID=UPI001C8C2528
KAVEAKQEPVVVEAELEKKQSWFERLRSGLSRSSQQLGDSIGGIFTKRKLDEDTLQELEDVLIQADLGLETAMRITDSLSSGR